jgi:hypothetical protein
VENWTWLTRLERRKDGIGFELDLVDTIGTTEGRNWIDTIKLPLHSLTVVGRHFQIQGLVKAFDSRLGARKKKLQYCMYCV